MLNIVSPPQSGPPIAKPKKKRNKQEKKLTKLKVFIWLKVLLLKEIKRLVVKPAFICFKDGGPDKGLINLQPTF